MDGRQQNDRLKGIVFLCVSLPIAFVAAAAVLGFAVRAFLWAGGW